MRKRKSGRLPNRICSLRMSLKPPSRGRINESTGCYNRYPGTHPGLYGKNHLPSRGCNHSGPWTCNATMHRTPLSRLGNVRPGKTREVPSMTISEEQAERIKLAAAELSTAESRLISARKAYNRAQRNYDQAAQTRLD